MPPALYTVGVVRFRRVAFVLALLYAALPAAGILCLVNCDQPRKPASCHESATSADGVAIQGLRHACNRDHGADAVALVVSNGGRGLFRSLVATGPPALIHASVGHAQVIPTSGHGPPGPDGHGLSARVTILRI